MIADGVGQDATEAEGDDRAEHRVGFDHDAHSTPGEIIRCTIAPANTAGPSSSSMASQARANSVALWRSSAMPARSDRPRRTMPLAFSTTGYPTSSAAANAPSRDMTTRALATRMPYASRSAWVAPSGSTVPSGHTASAWSISAVAASSSMSSGRGTSTSWEACCASAWRAKRPSTAKAGSGKAKTGIREPGASGPSSKPNSTATSGLDSPGSRSRRTSIGVFERSGRGGA